MFPQRLEEGMVWVLSIPTGLQVIPGGEKSLGLEGDAPEFLPLADDVDDGLVPVGLAIIDLQAANLGFSSSCSKESEENSVITFAVEGSSIRYPENGLCFFRGEKLGLFLLHGSKPPSVVEQMRF